LSTRSKVTYAAGIAIGILLYLVIFIYIYKGDFRTFITVVSRGNPESILFAYIARVAYLFFEAMIWWSILRIFGKVSILKTCEVMFAAIFVEFVLPVGGATEVARYLLAVKLKLADREGTVASIFIHRLINSITILITTLISLILVSAPFPLFISLFIPALILVSGNVALYILPKYKWVERYADKFLNRVGMSIEGMSENYKLRMSQVRKAYSLLALAFAFAFLERIANGVYGIEIASIAGINLPFPSSLLSFDSLYTIMWLFPAITPGGIGIFEFIQTGLLSYLGISVDAAATISIISRLYYVIGEYPLFVISAVGLGFKSKDLLKQLARYKGSTKRNEENRTPSVDN
jgi:uncharacterized protein (TIRG00374 family)